MRIDANEFESLLAILSDPEMIKGMEEILRLRKSSLLRNPSDIWGLSHHSGREGY